MTRKMNAEPTAEAARNMADTMEEYARQIRRIASRMQLESDLSAAADVVSAVTNCFLNLRLDLMVVRPIREYEYERAMENEEKVEAKES